MRKNVSTNTGVLPVSYDGKDSFDSATQNRVKELRKLNNLTQEEFAESINYSVSLVTQIEQGKKPLTLDVAKKIRERYSKSLDWIYCLSEESDDEVSNTLIALKKFFNLRSEGNEFSGLVIDLDSDLVEFLVSVHKSEKAADELDVSAAVRASIIEEQKQKLNNKLKNRVDRPEIITYQLCTEDHLERLNTIMENKKHVEQYGY